jgi:hypothetical protein
MTPRSLKSALAMTAAALALSACASTGKTPRPATKPAAQPARPAAPTAIPGLEVRDRIQRIVALLELGQAPQARVEALAALEQQPGNATARKLLDEIDLDPRQMLGEKHYAYKVRPGEKLSEIAGRLLGDPMLFYALARYNDIALPEGPKAGQMLLIPGVRKKAAPAPAPAAAAPPPAAAVPGRDPVRARALRGQALANMNSGAIDQAVARLRQAQALDPANALIKRDLDRAVRIQATVHNR